MTVLRTIALGAGLALAPVALAAQDAPAAGGAAPRVIQVTGEGRSTAAPDLARVSLGVAQQSPTAGEAMAAMGTGIAAVLARLEAAGIAAADVQTGQLSLQPVYDYNAQYVGTPPLVGYLATQILDVRVRDVAKLGDVLDAAVADGANQVNGVFFDLADPQAAMDEARRDAVADGRARAEVYAEAAGVALGDLLSISESVGGVPIPGPMFDRVAQEAASVPVAPGQLDISVTATLTFAIAQ